MRALLVVDVQNDFLPGGALAVPNGDRVIEPLAREIREGGYDVIAFSRDVHPANHCSFREQGGPWPPHCVLGTAGALTSADLMKPYLNASAARFTVAKGRDPGRDAYSAFDGTDLAKRLRSYGVTELVAGGLATEYCVRATVLDAAAAGFSVAVREDCIAGIDRSAGDAALAEMNDAKGVEIIRDG